MNVRRGRGDRQRDNNRWTNNVDDTPTKVSMDRGRLIAEANTTNTKINARISANSTGSIASEASVTRKTIATGVSQSFLSSVRRRSFKWASMIIIAAQAVSSGNNPPANADGAVETHPVAPAWVIRVWYLEPPPVHSLPDVMAAVTKESYIYIYIYDG